MNPQPKHNTIIVLYGLNGLYTKAQSNLPRDGTPFVDGSKAFVVVRYSPSLQRTQTDLCSIHHLEPHDDLHMNLKSSTESCCRGIYLLLHLSKHQAHATCFTPLFLSLSLSLFFFFSFSLFLFLSLSTEISPV